MARIESSIDFDWFKFPASLSRLLSGASRFGSHQGLLEHTIKLAAVFSRVPVGLFAGGPLELEQVLAEQAQYEAHRGDDQEEEYNQQHFAENLANMEADGHAAPVKPPEAEGANNCCNNKQDRNRCGRSGDRNGQGAFSPEQPQDGVNRHPDYGGEFDPFNGFFFESKHGFNPVRGGIFVAQLFAAGHRVPAESYLSREYPSRY